MVSFYKYYVNIKNKYISAKILHQLCCFNGLMIIYKCFGLFIEAKSSKNLTLVGLSNRDNFFAHLSRSLLHKKVP